METIKIVEIKTKDTLKAQLNEIEADEEIRALILSFVDEESFANENDFDADLIEQIKSFSLPVITIIMDVVKGFVFEIVLASHISFASEEARFFIDNKEQIAWQIGSKNVEKLKDVENEFDAETALDLGIINKIESSRDLEKEAVIIGEQISNLAPIAIRSCLKAVNKGLEITLEDALKLETELFSEIFATQDMKEGTSAFLEKRKAVFKGE